MLAGRRELNFAPASLPLDLANAGTAPAGIAPAAGNKLQPRRRMETAHNITFIPLSGDIVHGQQKISGTLPPKASSAIIAAVGAPGGRPVRQAEGGRIVAPAEPTAVARRFRGVIHPLRNDPGGHQSSAIDASPRRPAGLGSKPESSDVLTMTLLSFPPWVPPRFPEGQLSRE
jgi:hypothetical protein